MYQEKQENIFERISGRDKVDCRILTRLRQHPREDVEVNEQGAFYQGVCIAEATLVKEDDGNESKLQPPA